MILLMTPRKPRLKDIARLAGVSIGTVDRVLHDRGEVAEKTRERVKQILTETNYSPDVMASVLKSRKAWHLVSLLPEPSDDNAFWQKHPAGIKRAMEELNLFRVNLTQVTFDMLNEEDFQVKARKILDLKPDGVLLAPIFKDESVVFCERLKEMGTPFVFVDGFIEQAGFLAFIGEDAYRSGRVAGQLASMITGNGRDILIVSIARNIQNVHHLNNRIKGFMGYFENNGTMTGKRVMAHIPDPSGPSVREGLRKAFSANPDIGSVYMSGSKSYLVASCLAGMGMQSVDLIGYDLLDRNVSCLKEGTIRFLIGQRPEEQTYKAVRKLFEYLSLNKVPERMEYLPVDIVTKENAEFFI